MALTQEFNEFAGKIVSKQELTEVLRQAGYSDADLFSPSPARQAKLLAKTLALPEQEQEEVDQLQSDVTGGMYIEAEAFKALAEPILQAKDEPAALANFALFADHLKEKNLYIDAQPIVKLTSWMFGGEKIADDFIKAVAKCADHRESGLVKITQGIESIAQAVTAKFPQA